MIILLMTAILVLGLVNLVLCGATRIWKRPHHRFLFPAIGLVFLDIVMFLSVYVQDSSVVELGMFYYPIIYYALLFMALFGYEVSYQRKVPVLLFWGALLPVVLISVVHLALRYEIILFQSPINTYLRYGVGLFVGVLFLLLIGRAMPKVHSTRPLEFKLVLALLTNLFFTCLVLLLSVLISAMLGSVFVVPYYYFKWVEFFVLIILYLYLFELLRRQLMQIEMSKSAQKRPFISIPQVPPIEIFSPEVSPTAGLVRTPRFQDGNGIKKIAQDIELFFATHQDMYLEAGFNFSTLCAHMNVSPRVLSLAFSKEIRCSFPDYINKWRISHAIIKLKAQPSVTVTELCYHCGYKSRATLYTNFKKETGMDISQYRKNLM